MENEYIILDEDKHPAHKFKDGVGAFSWEDVQDCDNIGLIVPEPFVVLDFDTESDSRIMLDIIESLDLHCRVLKTDRGIHCWFRVSKDYMNGNTFKNFTKSRLAIGIYCDRKVCNKNAYVVVKRYGRLRKWLRDYSDDKDVDFLPAWLLPVEAPQRFSFMGMKPGCRNSELYNYIIYLQNKGFQKDDIKMTLNIINKYVFDEPLSAHELDTILRDEAFKFYEELNKEKNSAKHIFDQDAFAKEVMSEYRIIFIAGTPYIFTDGYYKEASKELKKIIGSKWLWLKRSQIEEVIYRIEMYTDVDAGEVNKNKSIVNLKNGRYDLDKQIFLEHDSSDYDLCRIPVVYDEDAQSPELDKFLEDIFLNDQEVIMLFEELAGYCLMKDVKYHKLFILYGNGRNGKSTVLELLIAFLGENNVSNMGLTEMLRQFSTASLVGKLANICSDMNYEAITKNINGKLKSVVAGDSISAERKYKDLFTFKPYATPIFSTNDLPSSSDMSEGMIERFCFIPCLAKFEKGKAGYNENMLAVITTEKSLSALFNKAVTGYIRLKSNHGFTQPNIVKKAIANYLLENDTVLSWIDENEYSAESDIFQTYKAISVYKEYLEWCKINKPCGTLESDKEFYKRVEKHLGLKKSPKQVRRNGTRAYYFIRPSD